MDGFDFTPVEGNPFAGQQQLLPPIDPSRPNFGASVLTGQSFGPGPQAFASPYVPSFGERVGGWASGALRALGASPGYAENFGQGAANIAGFTPAASAYDAGRALGGGSYGEALVNAIGAYGGPLEHAGAGALAMGADRKSVV